jgi:hypothetical protein
MLDNIVTEVCVRGASLASPAVAKMLVSTGADGVAAETGVRYGGQTWDGSLDGQIMGDPSLVQIVGIDGGVKGACYSVTVPPLSAVILKAPRASVPVVTISSHESMLSTNPSKTSLSVDYSATGVTEGLTMTLSLKQVVPGGSSAYIAGKTFSLPNLQGSAGVDIDIPSSALPLDPASTYFILAYINAQGSGGWSNKLASDTVSGIGVMSAPTGEPTTRAPTNSPTDEPITRAPTDAPTDTPTGKPTTLPPTGEPTTNAPTDAPTDIPTGEPTTLPPTGEPTTRAPTDAPTDTPTGEPTTLPPTSEPTTKAPTYTPKDIPTGEPTTLPPTSEPTTKAPTYTPKDIPTGEPTTLPPTSVPTPTPIVTISSHESMLSTNPSKTSLSVDYSAAGVTEGLTMTLSLKQGVPGGSSVYIAGKTVSLPNLQGSADVDIDIPSSALPLNPASTYFILAYINAQGSGGWSNNLASDTVSGIGVMSAPTMLPPTGEPTTRAPTLAPTNPPSKSGMGMGRLAREWGALRGLEGTSFASRSMAHLIVGSLIAVVVAVSVAMRKLATRDTQLQKRELLKTMLKDSTITLVPPLVPRATRVLATVPSIGDEAQYEN